MTQLLIANHVIDNMFTWLSVILLIAMFGSYIITNKLKLPFIFAGLNLALIATALITSHVVASAPYHDNYHVIKATNTIQLQSKSSLLDSKTVKLVDETKTMYVVEYENKLYSVPKENKWN